MRLVRLLLVLVAAALTCSPLHAASLAAYGKLAPVELVTVSPSGAQLAMVVTDGLRRTVVVQDLATKAFKTRADFGEVSVQRIRWAGERHLLITTEVQFDPAKITGGLRDWPRLHVFDVEAQTLKPLLGDTASGLNNVLRAPIVRVMDGRPTVFVEAYQFIEGRGYAAVYQVDLKTGKSKEAQSAMVGSLEWLVGDDGRTVARRMHHERPRRAAIEVRVGDVWREVYSASEPEAFAKLVGLGRDSRSVVYSVPQADGDLAWREVRLDGAPAPDPLVVPGSHGPLVDPQTGRVLGHAGWDGDLYHVVYFDPDDDRVMQKVRNTYPNISAQIESWSNDRNRIVAYIDRAGRLPGGALFDMAAGRAEWIGEAYPELTDADVASQTRVRFKAGDGLELTGYLTRPPGRAQERNLPLIVFPHRGPNDRDTPGFDWIVQAMASRGYAVLQVNFRGSGGLGEALRKAGDGEIGRKMQTDLSDGVRALANGGVIDPARVCIVGQGYGGYAALAGATLDPEPYRCAVSIGGFFELPRAPVNTPPGIRYEAERNRILGVDGPNDPRRIQLSPLRQAASVRVPVLLIHGENDTSVPTSQSEAMAAALTKAGKSVELLLLKNGDRRFANAAAGLGMLTATMAFVEKHNPPN